MLAFLIFALDDAHGMTVAWIANRNALIAATLALPALAAHHRWLALGWRPGAFFGPLCFALGLCAGETAIALFGYLLAHALVLDRGKPLSRLLHLLPYLALLGLWRALFGLLGLGAAGSGAYHDPGREPLAFALALVEHLPVLLGSQLALPLADVWFWGASEAQRVIWLLCAAGALAVLGLGHALLSNDREARFWTFGMLLSACVVAASVPGERLLLVPGLGGAALVARLILALLPADRGGAGNADPSRLAHWAGRARRPALVGLVALHLVLAPLMLPPRAGALEVIGAALARADRGVPADPAIEGRTVVVLNAPFDVMLSLLQPAREAAGVPRPAHLYWLATASSQLAIERVGARSLRVRPERGFLYSSLERHYRGDPRGLQVGATRALSEMTVRVVEVTADGRPQAAEFRFREPLESPRYRFLSFADGELVPAALPALGARTTLPREDFFAVVLDEALRAVGGQPVRRP
jgi:hypothetical protein